LRQEADLQPARVHDRALGRLVVFGEQAQQRCLAGAVRPDERDPRAVRYADGHAAENIFRAKGPGEVLRCYECHRYPLMCAVRPDYNGVGNPLPTSQRRCRHSVCSWSGPSDSMPNREDSFIIQAMAATRGRNISMKELRETVEAEHASVAVAGAILAVGGWSGLLWVVLNTLPTVPNRWSFYALLFAALAGTALPFIRLLHRRFSREGGLHISPGVMVRQALWVGLFGTVCA